MAAFAIIAALVIIIGVAYVVYRSSATRHDNDQIDRTTISLTVDEANKFAEEISAAVVKVGANESQAESVKFFLDDKRVIQIDIKKEI